MNTNEVEGRESLEEGRQIFEDWIDAMARAGEPLPPGGSLMASRSALMLEVYRSVQRTIATILEIPPSAVDIKISSGFDGGRHVDISIPKAAEMPDKEFHVYAERVMHEVHRAHMDAAKSALEGFDEQARPDLVRKVIALEVEVGEATHSD